MRELAARCGLPLALAGDGRLAFAAPLPPVTPAVRTGADLRPVLRDGVRPAEEGPAYLMYRGVCLPEHRDLFSARALRYDLTVLRPGTLGGEYVKTFGHYHGPAPGSGVPYPEVYQVVHGRAHFLLQRPAGEAAGGVAEVLAVEAAAGEAVLIPSGYGHVTINPGEEHLVLANLVAADCVSDYAPFRERRGAAYYELAGGGWEVNPRYGRVPPLRRVAAGARPWPAAAPGVPLYEAFVSRPENFRFLAAPGEGEAR